MRLRTGIIAWRANMHDLYGGLGLTATEPPHEIERQFLGMMSHELRSPMQSVLGYTALLLGGYRGSLTDEQRQDLCDIQVGAERLLIMIEQMLDLSHIHASELAVNVEQVELGEHLGQVCDVFAPVAAMKELVLRLEVPSVLPAVRGDPTRIRQILHILIDNAIKFTDAGEVHVRAEVRRDEVTIAVQDTGIGIAPEMIPRVFVPFQQGDRSETRRFGGAGLGLALAYELAQLMGGRLDAESLLGEGTTFTLCLPRLESTSPVTAYLRGLHCP